MKPQHIHIISFDNPYPPAYGGAIDVFYRIKALADCGVRITLHCFYKGTLQRSDALESLCEKVYYYPRKTGLIQHLSIYPYGVMSRNDSTLLEHLLEDESPILFEGLVSCGLMNHPSLHQRKKYFRECNVEHDYYHALGKASSQLWKKLFFHIEAIRLKYFERVLCHADAIFALAHQDEVYFRTSYPTVRTCYTPCFHPFDHVDVSTGTGKYILYHGNLSVAENHKAAMYIVKKLADSLPYPIIIAGRHPNAELKAAVAQNDHITLVDSPDEQNMRQLIRDAQVHLLLTFQPTGIKLKLLHVLFVGRHVVVNPLMVVGTELEELCHIGQTTQQITQHIQTLMQQPMTQKIISQRQEALLKAYDNSHSVQSIICEIYG